MPPSKFDVLDKAVTAGGTNLTAKALGDRVAKALRDALCDEGLLSLDGTKFSLTHAGKEAWRKQAPADRVAEDDRRQREHMLAFVTAVKQKSGKKLTKTQLAAAPEAARKKAVEAGYVGATADAAVFTFTPAGETFLLANKPLDEQLDGLRESVRVLVADLDAAHKRMGIEVEQMGTGAEALAAAAADLRKDGSSAGETLQKVVAELSGFSRLVEAANQFRAATESRLTDATRRLADGTAKLADSQNQMTKAADDQRAQLAEAEERITKRLDELASKLDTKQSAPTSSAVVSPPIVSPIVPSPPPPPMVTPRPDTAKAVADEIVSFVAAVAQERSVGCDFVELYDHLRTKYPTLTIGTFHDALRALDDAGHIRLKDWPGMQEDMPRPELALFASTMVMYHVQPAR